MQVDIKSHDRKFLRIMPFVRHFSINYRRSFLLLVLRHLGALLRQVTGILALLVE